MSEQAKMMELAAKIVETREKLTVLLEMRKIMDLCGSMMGRASKYIDELEYKADEDLEMLSQATNMRKDMEKPLASLDGMVSTVKRTEDEVLPEVLSIFDEIIAMGMEE